MVLPFAASRVACCLRLRHTMLTVILLMLLAGLTNARGGFAASADPRRLPGLHRPDSGAGSALTLTELEHNNLGGFGPDTTKPFNMRFKGVTAVGHTTLDLVIDAEGAYTPFDVNQNGNIGGTASVSVKVGTRIQLRLKFLQTGTDIPAPMDRVYLTLYLVDPRQKVRVDYFSGGATVAGFERYCVADGSILKADIQEDPPSITFTASSGETTNPTEPAALTDAERHQSVTFLLRSTFEAPISMEVAGGISENAGINFAFSGTDTIKDSCHLWTPKAFSSAGIPNPSLATTTAPLDSVAAAPVVVSGGCEKSCTYHGVAATCRARIDWVAQNQYMTEDKPCVPARSLVVDMCPICHKCSTEEACAPPPPTTTTTTVSSTTTTVSTTTTGTSTTTRTTTTITTTVTSTSSTSTTATTVTVTATVSTSTATTATATFTSTRSTTTTGTTTATTTTERFDCDEGYPDHEEAWSYDKRTWCCEYHARGCHPMSATSTSTTTPEPFDCVEGFAHWEEVWSGGKREWCCRHHHRGCFPAANSGRGAASSKDFDCAKGYESWKTLWSYDKKAWCCEHLSRGCRFIDSVSTTAEESYDCEESGGHATFSLQATLLGLLGKSPQDGAPEESWSPEKRRWCCARHDRGCETTAAPATGSEPYRCEGSSAGWEYARRAWCCQAHSLGCRLARAETASAKPYDCLAGIDEWEIGWSEEKKAWCCDHHYQGCPTTSEPYDCALDYEQWQARWPYGKKAWCCRQYGRGCHVATTTAEPFDCDAGFKEGGSWTSDKKDYCCRAYGRACTTTTSEPFDCTAEFSTWKIDWSYNKQHWCCGRYGRGCNSVAPPRKQLLLADGLPPSGSPGTWPPTWQALKEPRWSARATAAGGPQQLYSAGGRWPALHADADAGVSVRGERSGPGSAAGRHPYGGVRSLAVAVASVSLAFLAGATALHRYGREEARWQLPPIDASGASAGVAGQATRPPPAAYVYAAVSSCTPETLHPRHAAVLN